MAGRCNNCGAELFEGQQFCRRCGTPTGLPASGDLPTQLFGGGGAPATGEVSRGKTDSVDPRATAHYPPVIPRDPPRGAFPPPRRKSRRWLLAFTILGVAGVAMLASLLAAIATRKQTVTTKNEIKERVKREVKVVRPEMPAPPAAPPEPGAEVIDEAGAEVSDDRTVVKRTFDLGKDAMVSVRNFNGPVRVEGWDEPRAEVKITKRGGTAEMRRAVRLASAQKGGGLSLQTLVGQGGAVEVAYEIKLPRSVARLDINSVRSDVELSNLAGAVSVDVKQGDIEMSDMRGPVRTNVVNGDTEVELRAGAAGEPSIFKSVNGSVELHLEGVNADLEAEVTNGSIDADEDLKLETVSRPGSKKATGRVGQGGPPVHVKVINGTVRLRG